MRTPQDSTLQVLAEVGLVVPDEIPLDDDLLLLDFTLLGNRDIGSIHSRYAVRHAHAIFQAAKAAARVATLKRGLRVSEAKFRISRKGQQLNVVQALMEDDDHITKQRDKVSKAQIEHDLIVAVSQGYEDIRNAASREISRRLGERAATD